MHLCMRLNQLSKHFCHSDWGISKTRILNASTASSGVEKRWPLILFLTYGNITKSFGAKSGRGRLFKLIFWVLKNANRYKAFSARLTNCVGSNANKFLWQSNVHVPWFPEQQLILDDLHKIRLGVNYDLGWIHHTIDKCSSNIECMPLMIKVISISR